MMPTMGPATVQIYDDFLDGEEITMAKITTLGVGDQATFKMYQWDAKDNRFRDFDTLTNASFVERDDHITVRGTSQRLADTPGLTEEGTKARWEIDLTGCQGCR